MSCGQGNDGEAAHPHKRRIREELVGLDLRERDGIGERFPCFDLDLRIFRVGSVDRDDGGGADGRFVVASFVNDEPQLEQHL